MLLFSLFKQKTAYEMRISDLSSDVCSSDLPRFNVRIDDRTELIFKAPQFIAADQNDDVAPIAISQAHVADDLEQIIERRFVAPTLGNEPVSRLYLKDAAPAPRAFDDSVGMTRSEEGRVGKGWVRTRKS